MFLRSDTKLVVKRVVPDLFHVVPVGYNTVLDGILEGQYTALGLGFVTLSGINGWGYLTDTDTYPT